MRERPAAGTIDLEISRECYLASLLPAPMIRPATAADLAEVNGLAETWARSGETRGFEAPLQSLLTAALGQCFFVAEHSGRIVGYTWGQTKRDTLHTAVVPAEEPFLEIEDLYIAPAERSKGLGHLLVEAVMDWARERGVRYILAYSSTRDVDGVLRFYRACGFESWAVQVFRDLGELS